MVNDQWLIINKGIKHKVILFLSLDVLTGYAIIFFNLADRLQKNIL